MGVSASSSGGAGAVRPSSAATWWCEKLLEMAESWAYLGKIGVSRILLTFQMQSHRF